MRWLIVAAFFVGLLIVPVGVLASGPVYRIDHVVDGDTVDLTTGAKVRLVQIDTPEVYFGTECYGPRASAIAKRLLPYGTKVLLAPDPATDRIDRYGRLLRYVIRARDGLNVNVYLVRIGAAAPYFYDGQRGRYAALLDRLARRARAPDISGCGALVRTHRTTRTAGSLHADDARQVSGFRFRLYSDDWEEFGEFETVVPNWSAGDEFMTGDGRRFRIVGIVPFDDDVGVFNALWKVEPVSG